MICIAYVFHKGSGGIPVFLKLIIEYMYALLGTSKKNQQDYHLQLWPRFGDNWLIIFLTLFSKIKKLLGLKKQQLWCQDTAWMQQGHAMDLEGTCILNI